MSFFDMVYYSLKLTFDIIMLIPYQVYVMVGIFAVLIFARIKYLDNIESGDIKEMLK